MTFFTKILNPWCRKVLITCSKEGDWDERERGGAGKGEGVGRDRERGRGERGKEERGGKSQ